MIVNGSFEGDDNDCLFLFYIQIMLLCYAPNLPRGRCIFDYILWATEVTHDMQLALEHLSPHIFTTTRSNNILI